MHKFLLNAKSKHARSEMRHRNWSKQAAFLVLASLASAGCQVPAVQNSSASSARDSSAIASQAASASESTLAMACAADSSCSSSAAGGESDKASQTRAITDQFEPLKFEQAIELFENGEDGLLYFGFPKCPWCQEVVPLLEKAAQDKGIQVLYVQTRDEDRNLLYTSQQKERIIPYLQDYIRDNDQGEPTLYVPLIVAIKDGKVAAGHQGTVDDHDARIETMSEQQRQEVLSDLKKITETLTTDAAS